MTIKVQNALRTTTIAYRTAVQSNPRQFSATSNSNSSSKPPVTCYVQGCGQPNHVAKFHDQWILNNAQGRAWAATSAGIAVTVARAATAANFGIPPTRATVNVAARNGSTESFEGVARNAVLPWTVDCASTDFITNESSLITSAIPSDTIISGIAAGADITAVSVGTAHIPTENGDLVLNGVLYTPLASDNILSLQKFANQGATTVLTPDGGAIVHSGHVHISSNAVTTPIQRPDDTFWTLSAGPHKSKTLRIWRKIKASLQLLHERMGHVGIDRLIETLKKDMVVGADFDGKFIEHFHCSACEEAKSHKLPHPRHLKPKCVRVGDLTHGDLSGPQPIAALGGYYYFLVLVDDCSSYSWVYLLKKKNEAMIIFRQWKASREAVLGRKILVFRTDGGGELQSNKFEEYLREEGLHHQTTTPRSSEQNGVSERMIRTLKEDARASIIGKGVPREMWGQAILTASWNRNRLACSTLKGMTPFEVVFGEKPDIAFARIFGCTVWVHIPKADRDAGLWSTRAQRGRMAGYSDTKKAWVVLLDGQKHYSESYDVKFWEPVNEGKLDETDAEANARRKFRPSTPPDDEWTHGAGVFAAENNAEGDAEGGEPAAKTPIEEEPAEEYAPEEELAAPIEEPDAPVEDIEENPRPEEDARPTRNINPPAYLGAYDLSRTRVARVFSARSSGMVVPEFRGQAMNSPQREKWIAAESKELQTFRDHEVYTAVILPDTHRAIPSHFVYDLKRDDFGNFQFDSRGDPDGQKARLVADGNRQKAGVDYTESYAPTARQESLRFVLAIACRPGMHLSQGDVKAAFLNSPMTEEVYLKIPVSNDEQMERDRLAGLVWRLHKAVYGLVQAARAWAKWLQQLLENLGFKRLSGSSINLCFLLCTSVN
jgi:transposase InsO family protein